MTKKILKTIFCFIGITSVIIGFFYFFQKHNKKKELSQDTNTDSDTEEHLNAEDALDLSSLKFSRHYVDLR